MTANVLLLFEFDPLVTFALEELVTLFDVNTPETNTQIIFVNRPIRLQTRFQTTELTNIVSAIIVIGAIGAVHWRVIAW